MAYWQRFKITNINNTGVTAEVYAYTVPVTATTVSSLGSSSVYDSSYQGVNGTFFGTDSILGIAVENGAAVRTGGLKNGSSTLDRNRSTMYMTMNGTVGVKRVVYASELPGGLSNLKWAIGGLGLYLDESLTKAQYDAKLAEEGVSGVGGVNDKRPRTMIGYIPDTGFFPGIVMAVAFDHNMRDNPNFGITFYDGRVIMAGLGCTQAIHLDGGSSSSIRFIDQPQDEPSRVIRYRASTVAQKTIFRSTYRSDQGSMAFPAPSPFEPV